MARKHEAPRQKHKADVAARLTQLKGKTRSDLARDDRRMATSPLGMGTGAKKKGAGR